MLCSKGRKLIRFVHLTMKNVVARRFPLKYKKEGLLCTDCGCDCDPLRHTYNHCDDEFPHPNELISVPSYEFKILSVICVYFILYWIWRRLKIRFCEMKKKDLVKFLEKNDLFLWKERYKESVLFQVSKINTTNNNNLRITTKKVVFDIITRIFTLSKKNDSYYEMKFDDIAHITGVP